MAAARLALRRVGLEAFGAPGNRGDLGRVEIQGEPKCLEFDLLLLFLLVAYGRSA